jgi:hypothetical protein
MALNRFGELLRKYRKQCIDVENSRPLTQERLGELLGKKLGTAGYTGSAISDWERGKSQINKDHRIVLMGLIKVLLVYGGIRSKEEANALLEAGNFRSFDEKETADVFQEDPKGINGPADASLDLLLYSPQKIDLQSEQTDWTVLLLDALRSLMRIFSRDLIVTALVWSGVWWINWRLTIPFLQWPYQNLSRAKEVTMMYVAGAIVLPAVIGLLCRTKDEPFWMERRLEASVALRLYTQIGSYIGYHTGFLTVFGAVLVGYYLGLKTFPQLIWLGAAAWPVIMAYLAARQAPRNHWAAYNRLEIKDSAILSISVFVGPLLGGFFLAYHPVLLSPIFGSICLLIAVVFIVVFVREE